MKNQDPIEDIIEGNHPDLLLTALARLGRARRPGMELAEALLQEASQLAEDEEEPAVRLAAAEAVLSFPQEYHGPGIHVLLDHNGQIAQLLQVGGEPGHALLLSGEVITLRPDDWVDLPGVRAPPIRLRVLDVRGRELELIPAI